MKCASCGGEEITKETMREDGAEFPIHLCQTCGDWW